MLIQSSRADDIGDLAALLVDAVDSGACVGFLEGLTPGDALSFWTSEVDRADTWVARLAPDGRAVGVVQLHTPKLSNGGHRAEVAKLMVHRSVRGRGLAKALMAEVEQQAKREGRWLLQLDTETGSAAEALYVRLGWQVLGVIPDHAVRPSGELVPTTFLFKRLSQARTRRSTGCPVTVAITSKSLSTWSTVRPASSAVAATIRSGIEGAR